MYKAFSKKGTLFKGGTLFKEIRYEQYNIRGVEKISISAYKGLKQTCYILNQYLRN